MRFFDSKRRYTRIRLIWLDIFLSSEWTENKKVTLIEQIGYILEKQKDKTVSFQSTNKESMM